MVRALAILLENDLPHKPIISHAIIILFMVCVIGVVIFNCGHKANRRPPQPMNNMTYYGNGGGGYNYPSNAGGGRGGGMGGAALGLAAGAGVGLAAGLAIDAVIDNDRNNYNGGGGCGGGGGGGLVFLW
ncbi:loricrin-like protein [Carex littledalei]|uniref:Loricrin-like protein n=1 Tax=Carex littledalei TaxID=544730 RepID=A0A833RIX8_9POAL|nr:loricrin-like protein [Carex littledalei]